MSRLSISRCAEYEREKVEEAVREAVGLVGGMGQYVKPGQKVLLKPNLLAPRAPDRAVTTHPYVVEAVARMVQEAGGDPVIADSHGAQIPFTQASLRHFYRVTGMQEVAERTGASLNWNISMRDVPYPDGLVMKRLEIMSAVLEADVIISLPKLKTHVLTLFTGATKNLFGCVPGLSKPAYHARMGSLANFASMLLDIVGLLKPSLIVMDGVVGMEGKGPGGGQPRKVGVIVAGDNSLEVDAVCCHLVGINPMRVEMLRIGYDRGLWAGDVRKLEVLGVSPGEARLKQPFNLPPLNPRDGSGLGGRFNIVFNPIIGPIIRNYITMRPHPNPEICTGCGQCAHACPRKAITIVNKKAVVDYSRCIFCYCCDELCPEGAVELRRPLLGRLIYRQNTRFADSRRSVQE